MTYISPVRQTPPDNMVSETEKEVFDLLKKLEIPYYCVENDSVETMEECLRIDEALGTEVRKSIFLTDRKKTVFFLVILPAAERLKSSGIEKKYGTSRLSFASGELMQQYLGLLPGEASIMGLLNDREGRVQLIVDRRVADAEWFGCNPATNKAHIRIATKDLMEKFLPAIHHKPDIMDL